MESFEDLVRELNEIENENQTLFQQYTELKRIVLQDCDIASVESEKAASSSKVLKNKSCNINNVKSQTASKTNIQTEKIGTAKNASIDLKEASYKKLAKIRIKNFHTVMDNINNFKASNREKKKFLNNLSEHCEAIINKENENSIVNDFMNTF